MTDLKTQTILREESRTGARASARDSRRRQPKEVQVLNGAARFRKWWVPYVWMALPLAAVFAFYIFPFANTLLLSLTNAKPLGSGTFIGLENYVTLATDQKFLNALLNSVIYAIGVVPFMTFIPLLVALLVQKNIPGIGLFRSLYYLPAIASVVIVALAWSFLLKDDGMINEALKTVGVIHQSLPFLTERWLLLSSAMVLTLWKGIPYYMILYLSALANVDRSLYEAAQMDGAGAVRRFWSITVPGVRIMMYLVAVLSAIGSMKVFTEVFLLSNGTGGIAGSASTLAMYIREVGIADSTYGSLGLAGAASVALFAITIGLMIASRRLNRKVEES